MTQLLHVNASPRGAQSQSLALAEQFIETYSEHRPGVVVDTLDLFEGRLPDFGSAAAAAKYAAFAGADPDPEGARCWAEARAVFERFAAAGEYVFNVPMWNHGVPYVLKQWIDVITQPGWVFGFDPAAGYTGLLTGRRAIVVYTSGVWAPGVPQSHGVDFHGSYFTDWLRFAGITDVTEIRYAGNALEPDPEAAFGRAAAAARAAALDFADRALVGSSA